MKSTFRQSDVVLLLKDITGRVEPLPAGTREKQIQSGVHYCEMLPLEYQPSQKYLNAYYAALKNYAAITAKSIATVAEKIHSIKGNEIVIISLARAGIPVGILIKRYLEKKYCIHLYHYSISIIRGRGIDRNALNYILSRHNPESIQFVDGWIGKGAILRELRKELQAYPMLHPDLAVVSDPANLTDLCGTHEDFVIPSSCLNATITGLISRTFLRPDIIRESDYHGASYLEELFNYDLTNEYLDTIEREFDYCTQSEMLPRGISGMEVVKKISDIYRVRDINFIKPGIGETTRVLLRRVPWKVLLNARYQQDDELEHIKQLALEKRVEIETAPFDLGNYKVCGIIKDISEL